MFESTLRLISSLDRRTPARSLATGLDALFHELRAAPDEVAASQIEDQIWQHWMEHPAPAAANALAQATRAIGADQTTEAGRLLDAVIMAYPDFAEAWNKRATFNFLQNRDVESVADIQETLQLEPRHFGALCGFAQICLRHDARDAALFAFDVALRINPHLGTVRRAYDEILKQIRSPPH